MREYPSVQEREGQAVVLGVVPALVVPALVAPAVPSPQSVLVVPAASSAFSGLGVP